MIRMSEVKRRNRGQRPAQVNRDDGEEEEGEEKEELKAEGGSSAAMVLLKVMLAVVVVPPLLNWAAVQREKTVLLNATR